MQFAIVAKHSPELCPTANATTRELMKQGAGALPDLAAQLGVNILNIRVYGPDHVILGFVEAPDIETAREFAFQSRLAQWNTVNINATWSMEEALERLDQLPAIF